MSAQLRSTIFKRLFLIIFLESSETHFDLVASKMGAELNFSLNYSHGNLDIYCGQFSNDFEYKIDHSKKPLNTIVLWRFERFQRVFSIGPTCFWRGFSLSDSCTSDRCCFSCLFFLYVIGIYIIYIQLYKTILFTDRCCFCCLAYLFIHVTVIISVCHL